MVVSGKKTAIRNKYNKSQILGEIANNTNLSKKQVNDVIDELATLIERHIRKGGAGEFTLPGLIKIKSRQVPPSKARKGVPNPFQPGELMDIAAKPATTKLKLQALKRLREFV